MPRNIVLHREDGVEHPTSYIDATNIRRLLWTEFAWSNEGSFFGGDFYKATSGGVTVTVEVSGVSPTTSCITLPGGTYQSWKWVGDGEINGTANTLTACAYGAPRIDTSGTLPPDSLGAGGITNGGTLVNCSSPDWSGKFYTSADCTTGEVGTSGVIVGIGFGVEYEKGYVYAASFAPSPLGTNDDRLIYFYGEFEWCDIEDGMTISNSLSGSGGDVTFNVRPGSVTEYVEIPATFRAGADAGSGGTITLKFCEVFACSSSSGGSSSSSSSYGSSSSGGMSSSSSSSAGMSSSSSGGGGMSSSSSGGIGDRTHDFIELQLCEGGGAGVYTEWLGRTDGEVWTNFGQCFYYDPTQDSTDTNSPAADLSTPIGSCTDCVDCPTDCTACCASFVVDVDNMDFMTGSFLVEKTGDATSCTWRWESSTGGRTRTITVICFEFATPKDWIMGVDNNDCNAQFKKSRSTTGSDCPGPGAWTLVSTTCTGATPTASGGCS